MTGEVRSSSAVTQNTTQQQQTYTTKLRIFNGQYYKFTCPISVNSSELFAAANSNDKTFMEFVNKNGVKLERISEQEAKSPSARSNPNEIVIDFNDGYYAGYTGEKKIEKVPGTVSPTQTERFIKEGVITETPTGVDSLISPQKHTLYNMDAGAGQGATVKVNKSTVMNLSLIPPEILAQSPFKELIGTGDKDGNYMVKDPQKLATELQKYYNTLNHIQIEGDDDEYNTQVRDALLAAGAIDENGQVKDPAKVDEIVKNGLTVNDKKFDASEEAGEQIEISVSQKTNTKVESKFKEMDPRAVKAIPEAQLKENMKKGFVTKVGDKYYTTVEGLQLKGAVENNQKIEPTALVGNTQLQDVREEQLQREFMKIYDSDPDMAQDALLHTKYYKEYHKLIDSLRALDQNDMADPKKKNYAADPDYKRKGVLSRMYFAQSRNEKGEVVFEYATDEDVKNLRSRIVTHLDDIVNKKSVKERRDEYNSYFSDVSAKVTGDLSDEQMLQLAEAKAYAEPLKDSQINHMASVQFKNRFNTELNNIANDYQEKINAAKAKGKPEKAKKLAAECEAKLQEVMQRKVETENLDRADYAKMMARGQLNSEIGQGSFENANPTYESIVAKVPEAAKFIDANKDLFYVDGKFSADAWKNFWLQHSKSERDNTLEHDSTAVEDYYLTLGEAEGIVSGNARGTAEEGFVGLGAILGKSMSKNAMIDLARDMSETAGIPTEKNKTVGIRVAYVTKNALVGGVGAEAAHILGNFLMSRIKIPYAGTVIAIAKGVVTGEVSGVVSGTVSGVAKGYAEGLVSGVKEGTVSGTVGKWIEGVATGEVDGTVGTTVSGYTPYADSGVIQGFDKLISQVTQNGEVISNIESIIPKEYAWSTEGMAYFEKYVELYYKALAEIPYKEYVELGYEEKFQVPYEEYVKLPYEQKVELAYKQEYKQAYEKAYEQKVSKDYSGKAQRGMDVRWWPLLIGAGLGTIRGLKTMNSKHDMQDAKSEVQMYARDNYNRRTVDKVEQDNGVLKLDTRKFTIQLADSTKQKQEVPPTPYKMTVKYGGVETSGPYAGKKYNLAQDKESFFAELYGLDKNSAEFKALYKYLMENANGVSRYKSHEYTNDKTYNYYTFLPKELTGLEKDYTAGELPTPKFIKIYLADGVKTNIGRSDLTLEGESGKDVEATVEISHKRKK